VLRLLGNDCLQEMPNRRYFFGAAARAMRRVLVDHARHRGGQSSPEGGGRQRVPLDDVVDQIVTEHSIDLLALDEALVQLKARNPRQHDIVELKYFGGFKMKEIAEQLDLGKSMVEKDLHFAKAWLAVRMEGAQSDE
jgi:RNA polymerase sigma-70 factor (ECF subfamily)